MRGALHAIERGTHVIDLEHDLHAGTAIVAQAAAGEAEAVIVVGQLGDRPQAEDHVAAAQARIVRLASLQPEAENALVEPDRDVEVGDEQLEPKPHVPARRSIGPKLAAGLDLKRTCTCSVSDEFPNHSRSLLQTPDDRREIPGAT